MKKTHNYFIIIILMIISCSNKNEIRFQNNISEYNYLDKKHKLLYIYDFDSIINKDKIILLDSIKRIETRSNVSIIIITKTKISQIKNIDKEAKLLNTILSKKFNLDKLIVFEIINKKRQLSISTSKSIKNIINDSISKIIITNMKPKLKEKKYSDAISIGINIINHTLINYKCL